MGKKKNKEEDAAAASPSSDITTNLSGNVEVDATISSIFSDTNPFKRKPTEPRSESNQNPTDGDTPDDLNKRKRSKVKISSRDNDSTEEAVEISSGPKKTKKSKSIKLLDDEDEKGDLNVGSEVENKKKNKRKRDDVEGEYEVKKYGVVLEDKENLAVFVGEKRKKTENAADREGFDDEKVSSTSITFINKCTHPVWPGIQPGAGKPILVNGGFTLPPNKAYSLTLPPLWSGRFWGRHGCSFDKSGRGRCATGDCGGSLFCNGLGGAPPATLAEITLGNDQDFYDVSLVDGYNLAISITPVKGTGKCSYAGCVSDLNLMCPVGLQVRSKDKRTVVACKSACFAFNTPRYCCTGSYGNPATCKPTAYSRIFKTACPKAYSYAYDDPTSIATCTRGNYLVTFCPHHRR